MIPGAPGRSEVHLSSDLCHLEDYLLSTTLHYLFSRLKLIIPQGLQSIRPQRVGHVGHDWCNLACSRHWTQHVFNRPCLIMQRHSLQNCPIIPFCPTVAIPGYSDVFKHTNLYMVRTRPTPSRCCTAVSICLFTYLLARFGNLSSSPRNWAHASCTESPDPDHWTAGKSQLKSAFKSNGKYW